MERTGSRLGCGFLFVAWMMCSLGGLLAAVVMSLLGMVLAVARSFLDWDEHACSTAQWGLAVVAYVLVCDRIIDSLARDEGIRLSTLERCLAAVAGTVAGGLFWAGLCWLRTQ